jgi:hypothetical protein
MAKKFDPVLLPYLMEIRHNFTNYDGLVTFYQYYKKQRTKLNGVIYALLKEQIDIPTFHERVKQIEDFVDLTQKDNQKRFIKTEMERLGKQSFQPQSNRILRKWAKNNLAHMLHGRLIAKAVD